MARELVHVEGLRGVVDTLRQLPPEMVSKNGGVVRSGLRKGALVIRDAARRQIALNASPSAKVMPSASAISLASAV